MIVRWSVVGLLLLGLAALVLLGVLWSTAGNRLLIRLAEGFFDPALTISEVRGNVVEYLCAGRVTFEHQRVTVTATDICIEPNLWTSLDFLKVSLGSLEAATLDIRTHPVAESSDDGAGPELPVVVDISSVKVGTLSINQFEIGDYASQLALSNDDLVSENRFAVDGRDVRLVTSGPWRALRGDLSVAGVEGTVIVNLEAEELLYRIEATAARLSLGEFVNRDVILDEAVLTGEGDLLGYRFDIRSRVTDPLGSGRVEATGSGDWQGLELSSAQIREGLIPDQNIEIQTLTTSGRIDWVERVVVSFGKTAATGAFQGRRLAADLTGAVIDATGVMLERGRIRMAVPGSDNELRLDGRFGFDRTVDVALQASRLPLAQVDERFSGSLSAQVTLTGSFDVPALVGSFHLTEIAFDEFVAASASADIELSGNLDGPELEGSYRLTDLAYRGFAATSLGGELAGTLQRVPLVLQLENAFELESPAGRLAAEFSYEGTDDGTKLLVSDASLRILDSPVGALDARLTDRVEIQIAVEGIRIAPTCIELSAPDEDALKDAAICGEINYPQGPITIRIAPWQIPELAVSGDRVSVTGQLQGEVTLERLQPMSGRASVELSRLLAHHEEGAEPLTLGTLILDAVVEDDRARAEIRSSPGQGLELSGTLEAVLASEPMDSPVDGQLDMALDGLWAAETLLPMDLAYELNDMRGVLTLRAGIAGTLMDPELTGQLALREAGWEVIALNTHFNDFDLEAELIESDRLTFESTGEIGAGILALSGSLDALQGDDPTLTSVLKLENAAVVDLPDYSVVVDGELKLAMTSSKLRLDGDLAFPRASIRVAELPETAVTASDDEVLVGEETVAAAQQIRTTDVRIELGESVELDAFGLQARLVGNLRLRENPGQPQELTGTISLLEGMFEAYGQSLTVDRGQLTFSGPVDNPSVDVEASRVVTYDERDFRISLLISGTAQNLVTTVRSSPSLPEDDALALLITGRTFSQISSTEQNNVYGAALSLGLLSATGITQDMASSLGLEEIILDQDAQGNMEVGAAIRLNRDVYLRYTYGVFSRLGGVLLRYRLNNRFSVQAKTGDAHSIELRYGVDS